MSSSLSPPRVFFWLFLLRRALSAGLLQPFEELVFGIFQDIVSSVFQQIGFLLVRGALVLARTDDLGEGLCVLLLIDLLELILLLVRQNILFVLVLRIRVLGARVSGRLDAVVFGVSIQTNQFLTDRAGEIRVLGIEYGVLT